jgi:hypothetical protein
MDMKQLRDKTFPLNLKGTINLTTEAGVELVYYELEVNVTTCAADPSIGQPEHIEECHIIAGKLDIMESDSDGDTLNTCNLEGWGNFEPEGMEQEFNDALEALVWDALEDYDEQIKNKNLGNVLDVRG